LDEHQSEKKEGILARTRILTNHMISLTQALQTLELSTGETTCNMEMTVEHDAQSKSAPSLAECIKALGLNEKRVRFNPELIIHEIPATDDTDEEQLRKLFYRKEDYERFQRIYERQLTVIRARLMPSEEEQQQRAATVKSAHAA